VAAQFEDYLLGSKQPERVLGQLPLDGRPLAAAASIDGLTGSPRRHAVVARLNEGQPAVQWISYSNGKFPSAPQSFLWSDVETLEPIADSEPAIAGQADGGVRIAWVTLAKAKPRRVIILEAHFDAHGKALSHSAAPMLLVSPPRAARVLLLPDSAFPAVWCDDSRILTRSADASRVVLDGFTGKVPPALMPLRNGIFVLDMDAVQGLVLRPVR
jgi:hypothetical protein